MGQQASIWRCELGNRIPNWYSGMAGCWETLLSSPGSAFAGWGSVCTGVGTFMYGMHALVSSPWCELGCASLEVGRGCPYPVSKVTA